MAKEKGSRLIANNKKAYHDYFIEETYEAGIAQGKKLYDKRQDIAKKDQRREAERDFKVRNLY